MKKIILLIVLLAISVIPWSSCRAPGTTETGSVHASDGSLNLPSDTMFLFQAGTDKEYSHLDLCFLFYVPVVGNMQGIAYHDGRYYIGFDMGKEKSRICVLSSKGKLLKSTELLPINHVAELAFRRSDCFLYVTNGAPEDSVKIYAINILAGNPKIVKTISPDLNGYGAMVCIDNDHDVLIVSTNSVKIRTKQQIVKDDSTFVTFYFCGFDGKVKKKFRIPYQGIPQGLEYCKGKLYFYTNNQIVVLNNDGQILKTYRFLQAKESEGLTTAVVNGNLALVAGYKTPNRLYAAALDMRAQ